MTMSRVIGPTKQQNDWARAERRKRQRMVETLTISVWSKGLTHANLADELERIAALVRDGYQSGEVISEGNDGGHWDTKEA